MKKMRFSNEFKTGLVLVLGILIAVALWLRTANVSTGSYRLKTYFGHAEGIKENSIVALGGIEVGRVEKVRFVYNPEPRIELVLLLNNYARLHNDAIAFIAATGFVGDAYVGLTFGTKGAPFVKNGDTINSEDPVEMRILMKKADEIAGNLDKTLVDFRSLTQNLNGVVKDNKPAIDNMISNLEATTENFKEFSEDIKAHPWKLLMKGK